MPKQVHDVANFLLLAEKASECRVKRIKDVVKLKLRTVKYLYTLKVEPESAEAIIKQVKCQVIEV